MDAVDTTPLAERLAALPELADVPREQLAWLVEHAEYHREEDGYRIYSLIGLILLVSGRFSVRMREHEVEREMREITPGRVTGSLPYSRMTAPRGYLVADGPVEFLLIPREDLPEMTRECYEFTGACVQEMLARVRVFKAEDKHQEKMAALGRLSAGLAHELNNPASAVVRGAGELDAAREEVAAAARALGAMDLDETSRAALRSLEEATRRPRGEPLSPLDRASLEDEVMEWLERHGLDADLAYTLTDAGVTVADLDASAASLDVARLAALVRYVAADAAARGLSADILSAATRIHTLVAAVKKHTHMDRAPAVEPIRVEEHLSDAVTLLGSQASLKNVQLDLTVAAEAPTVMASVADLNQVWMHLIDNAIDAVEEGGRIAVELTHGDGMVVVCVSDNGPGIPDEDQERIFEPFFTTKDVGRGRGLGLDIVRTVVRTHGGTVELRSRPGCTEFRVALPVAGS